MNTCLGRRSVDWNRGAGMLILCLSVTACAIPVRQPGDDGTVYMTRDELRTYAEQVFRAHNRTLSRLIMHSQHLESRDPEAHRRLQDAEERMLTACEPMNQLAVLRRDERPADTEARMRVPDTVASCERETQRVERLLEEIEDDTGESGPE